MYIYLIGRLDILSHFQVCEGKRQQDDSFITFSCHVYVSIRMFENCDLIFIYFIFQGRGHLGVASAT